MAESEEISKREARRTRRAKRKMSNAKGTEREAAVNKKYGYNYEGAIKAGMVPEEGEHWDSRNPETGEILKGKKHPTIYKTKRAERRLGYKIKNVNGTLYSFPKNE